MPLFMVVQRPLPGGVRAVEAGRGAPGCWFCARRRHRGAAAALRTAADIGAEHVREEVEALVRRARLPVPVCDDSVPAGAAAFRLTRREREVLELVAQGRTDRQIGEQLFISHRTVERHVSNLLAKLDACTRAEMTAVAHRSGLVPVG
jgi:DNA-binding NarL/FixJ family response regulator